jgi:hypothetical protein
MSRRGPQTPLLRRSYINNYSRVVNVKKNTYVILQIHMTENSNFRCKWAVRTFFRYEAEI